MINNVTDNIERLSESALPQKITNYVESVVNEIERKCSDFEFKREKIEQELSRGARIAKRGLHL